MSEWQFTNPFFEEGKLAAINGLSRKDCPYDYIKYEEEKEIQEELYRQQEWLSGYNNQLSETVNEKSRNRSKS